jgi:RND family efflux transporter MFP subunit
VLKKLIIGVTVIAVLAVAAMVWARTVGKSGDDPYRDAQIVRVTRRDISTAVKATGVVKPMIGAEVRVGSRVSGVVRRLYVRVGDAVTQGQLLAELDARDLEARRGEAAAALEIAEANLRYASADLRRKGELRSEQLIAPSEMDLARQAFAVADRQCAQARANLDYATTQLGYARIVAPIAGVVESVTTQEGETVAASLAAPTFVTLVDLTRLEVRAYVDETDIGRIHVGQRAHFTVDTYPDHEFTGRVTAIYPQAEIRDNVVDYVAVLDIDAPRDRLLRPEMTTTTAIQLGTHEHVLSVPIRAVRREGGRSFVMRRRGDAVERQPVTTGIRDDNWVEIVDGLREGDEVAGETKGSEATNS